MSRFLHIWLPATRPKTLPAALAPVLIGGGLALHDGAALSLPALLGCFVGALGLQVGANFSNDYFDGVKGTDTPDRLGPRRAVAAGLVPPSAMHRASWLAFGVAALAAAGLTVRAGWPVPLILVAGVAAAILYTGGPWPLGYNGLGDVAAFLFFGPAAVVGTYYVQTLGAPPRVWVASLPPGLLAIALISINNLRDIDGDRRAGKRTLAVLLGAGFARVEYTLCVLGALAIPFGLMASLGASPLAALWTLPALLPAGVGLRRVLGGVAGPPLNGVLAITGLTLLLHSIGFAIALAWFGAGL